MENIQENQTNTKRKIDKRLVVISLLLFIIVGTSALAYSSYRSKSNLSNEISRLESEHDKLSNDYRDLADKKVNLEKAIKSLQRQVDETDKPSSADNLPTTTNQEKDFQPTAIKPAVKLDVSSVQDRPGTDFAFPNKPVPQGNFRVVALTLTNQSTANRRYDVQDFSATTTSGVIVSPKIYPPYEANVWNNTTLAPSGHQQIQILFGTDQEIVTLNWKASAEAEPVTVSLPKAKPLQ